MIARSRSRERGERVNGGKSKVTEHVSDSPVCVLALPLKATGDPLT